VTSEEALCFGFGDMEEAAVLGGFWKMLFEVGKDPRVGGFGLGLSGRTGDAEKK